MKHSGIAIHRRILIVLLIPISTAIHAAAQKPPEKLLHPPNSFSAEEDRFPGAVPLPDCVRRLLATDDQVVNTLHYANLSPEQLPDEWFTASDRDLGQNKGKLFVVMGASLMRGVNINPFWIFQHFAKSCRLLLNVGAHDIKVLDSKTNGLPHIKIAAATAVSYGENEFRFDGRSYQEVSRSWGPIGEEVPNDLSHYETREPLVQELGQSPDPVLSEARAWLWNQWWLERPSYLKVTLHSKEGDETTTTYFIRKVGGRLDVLIQIHKILVDRVPHPGARRSLIDDKILVATDIERRWALRDNPDRTTNVPEEKDVPPELYELYFIADSEGTIVIL
jgi:hypothetical protein